MDSIPVILTLIFVSMVFLAWLFDNFSFLRRIVFCRYGVHKTEPMHGGSTFDMYNDQICEDCGFIEKGLSIPIVPPKGHGGLRRVNP